MNNYDFSALNDREFEDLANALYEAEHSVRVERFKPGKDQGIDGRYFSPSNNQLVIIQAKHYYASKLPALLTSLKNERLKIDLISPSSYILYTSLALSPKNKEAIARTLHPHIQSSSDIYGLNDLNFLLAKHENIERAYYKLWIASTGVLYNFLNSGVLNRSKLLAQSIVDSERLFVRTKESIDAETKILNKGTVILTGEPGAGKTTIAKHLCAWSAIDNYSIIDISKPEDAFDLWSKDQNQIFYFDDFLGSNYLALLSRDSSSEIFRLIDAVHRDRTKRFVLTTRSVILNSAKQSSDVFRYHNSEIYELEISANTIGYLDKARILYSHIFLRLTDKTQKEAFYSDKNYIKIVRHRNYNPRLIEYITTPERLGQKEPEETWEDILKFLNNPEYIWDRAINTQAHPFVKLLIELVCYAGEEIEESALEQSFERMVDLMLKSNLLSPPVLSFTDAIRLSAGSLLARKVSQNSQIHITTINPSIKDYVFNQRSRDRNFLVFSVLSLESKPSLSLIETQVESKLVSKLVFVYLLKEAIRHIKSKLDFDFLLPRIDFVVKILDLAEKNGIIVDSIFLKEMIALILSLPEIGDVFLVLNFLEKVSDPSELVELTPREEIVHFLGRCLDGNSNKWDLSAVVSFARHVSVEDDDHFIDCLQDSVENYAEDLISDAKIEVMGEFRDPSQAREARDKVYRYVEEGLSEFGGLVDYQFLDDLVDGVDYDDEINDNINNSSYTDDESTPSNSNSDFVSDAQIDDIFHR